MSPHVAESARRCSEARAPDLELVVDWNVPVANMRKGRSCTAARIYQQVLHAERYEAIRANLCDDIGRIARFHSVVLLLCKIAVVAAH